MPNKKHSAHEKTRSVEEIAADIAREHDSKRMSELWEEMDRVLDEEERKKGAA
jgi:hypothetical protein